MMEKRKFNRSNSDAMVEITHPSLGTIELKAKDLSEGGMAVTLGNHMAPPVGMVVKARLKRHTGFINQEPVDMQVVHHHSGGLGLMFV